MLALSSVLFASVTVNLPGSLILSAHCSFVTRSVIVSPFAGSGTRQRRPRVILSRASPVSRLRSSPLIVIVTVGSQCRFSRSCAHSRSAPSVSLLWSVSTRHTMPQAPSFLLRKSPLMCRLSFPIG